MARCSSLFLTVIALASLRYKDQAMPKDILVTWIVLGVSFVGVTGWWFLLGKERFSATHSKVQ